MSRIYDSSAITQRRKNMAQAGSFINRIQSSTNPQTSYGPLQGIYDASIINSIKMGQPKEFYRNNGCIIISNGCPCSPIAINEITSGPTPPIILAPGSVRNIQLIYGSVIVTWEVSNTGGTSTSYTVTATATGQTTVTHQGITDLTYTFATIELMSGNLYTITVIGVNSAGNGAIYDGSNPTIDAPYLKPTYTTNTPTSTGVTISYSSYVAFLPALGTLFNSTGISIGTSTADATTFIITSGLSSETTYNNCYFRLTNGTNTSSNSDTFSFTTLTPVIVPGSVPSITSVYGTNTNGVDVTWTAPTTGGTPTSYTITAQSAFGSTVIVPNITALTYSFDVSALTSGAPYIITVIGVNSAGNGEGYSGTPSTIYAPYDAPVVSAINSSSADPGQIFINIDYLSIFPLSSSSPQPPSANYIIKQYVNNSTSSTTITGEYFQPSLGGGAITLGPSGLSVNNVYAFQVQLWNGNIYTSFTVKSTPPRPVHPTGPQNISVTNITSTTAQINYTNYSIDGYDLTTGGATAIITLPGISPTPDTIYNYTSLTNTSVIISGITQLTPLILYNSLTIKFLKNGIDSSTSAIPTFTTNGIAPVVTSSETPTTNNATIIFNNYSLGTSGQFDFTGATFSISGVSIESQPPYLTNELYIGGLSAETTYTNVTMTLTGSGGAISDPSNTFTIITKSYAPQNLSVSSTTTNSVLLNFDTYTPFDNSTTITAYNGGSSYVGTNISNGNVTIPLSSGQPGQSYPNMYIVLTTGSIISMPSNEVSFSTPYPAPSSLSSGTSTCITQAFEFTYNDFTPVSASIMNAPSGVSITLTQSSMLKIITLTGLTPSTQYSGMQVIQFRVEGGSGELSEYANIPTFNTPAPAINGNISGLDASSGSGEIVFNYEQFLGFIPTSAVVIANIVGVPTTYTVTGNVSVFGFTLTGLGNGTTLSDITVTLRDLDNCQQSNTATYSGSVTTKYPPPTGLYNFNLTNNSLQVGFTQYDDFEPYVYNQSYTNVVATIDGNTGQPVTISQASRTGVTLTGLFVGSSYTNVILTLVSSTGQAAAGATIQDFTPSYPGPDVNEQSISTGTDYVTIPYAQYTALNPSSGTLYSNGSQIGNLQSVSDTQMIINGLSSGNSYYNCYITLTDGSNTSNQSNTFFFATTGPPPPTPSAPAFQNYSNLQETTVELNYTSYTGFGGNTPTSGTFSAYNNNTLSYISLTGLSANSTTLYVTGLDQGTYYTQCTFTISDGNQTSDTASSSDFGTTSPPPSYPSPFITNISYNGTNATITYNDYSQELGSFGTPNGGTLYLNSGEFSVSATSADNTTMVVDISGVPLSTIYPNSYITVTNSTETSGGSNSQTIITAPDNIQVTPHNLAASINYTAYANTTISNVFITDVSDSNITYSSQSILPGSFIMTGPNGGNAYLNPGTTYNVKFYVQTDAGNSLESTISFTTTDSFPAVDIPIIPTQSYPYVTSTYDSMSPSVGVTFTFTSTYNAFYPFSPDNGELRNDMGTAQGTLASVSTNSVSINNITPTSTIFTGYTLIINYASFYSSGTAFNFTTYLAPTGVQQTNDPVNPTPPNQVDISFSYYDTSASFSSVLLILNDSTTYGTNYINYSSGSGTFSISGISSVGSFNAYIVLYNSGGYALLPSDVFPVTITSP